MSYLRHFQLQRGFQKMGNAVLSRYVGQCARKVG